MGYLRRFYTTGKGELPHSVVREAELLHIRAIENLIENYKILKSMVLNLDQTPVSTFHVLKQLLQSRARAQFQSAVFRISE